MRQSCQLCQAWTVLELLVVVAVVAVVLAVSVPVISGVLEGARKAQCSGNLRNLTNAALLYSADNGGKLLPVLVNHRAAGETYQGTPWVNLLWAGGHLTPNLAGRPDGRGTVLECRSRQGDQSRVNPSVHRLHYGYNARPGFLSTQHSHETWADPNIRRLDEIVYPAQTMAFAEVNLGYAIYPHLPRHRIYPHQDGVMASYFDGRVEWLKGPLPLISARPPGQGAPFY